MSHAQQLNYLQLVKRHFIQSPGKVLEIGSYDVNGSVRGVFDGSDYTGVDLIEGPGVDVVGSGHDVALPTEAFDVVLSSECFEHNPYWQATLVNMHRMVKNNGLIVVTCAGRGRVEHGTSRTNPLSSPGTHAMGSEYYLNLRPMDFESLDLQSMFQQWHVCAMGTDTYFVGWKTNPPLMNGFLRELPGIKVHQSLVELIYYVPVSVAAAILPEQRFQDFAVGYMRRSAFVRRLAGRLLRHLRLMPKS